MESPYTYKSLSPRGAKTRILELYPARDSNEPLRCRLRETDIHVDPYYEALSYTWGVPQFTEDLLIEEGGKWALMRITSNLRDALFRFRLPLDVRKLWVDALCINQQDDEEKALQIPLMSQIYRRASAVLVWLGQDDKGTSCLRRIDRVSRGIDDIGDVREIRALLTALLSLPWFSRRWIVQEVVLSPSVALFCGLAEMSWLRLLQVVDLAWPSDQTSDISVVQTMGAIWKRQFISSEPGSNSSPVTGILNLLHSFASLGCADARDRIYALAGLASDTTVVRYGFGRDPREATVQVSYTLPAEDVYVEFATMNFDALGGYKNILRLADQRSDGTHLNGKCSWIPDWRLPAVRHMTFKGWDFGKSHVMINPGYNSLQVEFEGDGNRPGYVYYGNLKWVSEPFPLNASDELVVRWIHRIGQFVMGWMEHNNAVLEIGWLESLVLSNQLERAIFQRGTTSVWYNIGDLNGSRFESDNYTGYKEFRDLLFDGKFDTSAAKLLSELRHVMEGRLVFIFLPITVPSTRSRSRWSRLGGRAPSPPPSDRDRNGLLWPTIGIGPSHASVGDAVCTSSIDVQQWSLSAPWIQNFQTWRFFECAFESTFLLRALNTNEDFCLYIGEARANRPMDEGSDYEKYERLANDYRRRLKKIDIR
ncbi:heterokaryon incompatibility protein-domain-containing protein [Hypoxylon crocopeplum]|nr:heterokaryon incompatibility protein-domain-containing protein [Hypoxylon crocopeplum]